MLCIEIGSEGLPVLVGGRARNGVGLVSLGGGSSRD